MSKKQLLDKIVKDWKPIVFCIGISLLIYLAYQATTLDKKTFVVPLEIKEGGSMVVAEPTDAYRYVKVSVRAPEDQIANLTEEDFSASLDLTYVTRAGQTSLPVVIVPNEKVLLTEPLEILASPEYISLNVDKKAASYVGIEPSFVGEPLYGYEVKGVSCEPLYAKATGPESLVKSLGKVQTKAVVIDEISSSQEFFTTLDFENSVVSLDDAGEGIRVYVTIEPKIVEAGYAGVPVAVTNLASGLEATLSQSTVGVSARGAQLLMDTVSPASFTARIDCSQITEPGTYELALSVSSPAGLTLLSQDISTVTVEVVPVLSLNEEEEL